MRLIDSYDWRGVEAHLGAFGWAVLPALLDAEETARLRGLYSEPAHFRSKVVMSRHGFGRGEYQYFRYPLPDTVASLRASLYSRLVALANEWNDAMGVGTRYPERHDEFLACCHAAGQTRPTPLLLQYGADDFNALHQDVYGNHVFPLQAMVLLAEPGAEFTGGEFLLVEQRPRQQSRGEVVPLCRGDAVIWAVRHRPVTGSRGTYRVNMKHGVSRIRSGHRQTLGVIFHDAA